MTLVATLYASATLFLREIETKTIYLILTRPLTRRDYLLGRVLGLILSTFFAILMMSILHVAILLTQGWHWDNSYPLALLGILLKMLIASALAVFFALSSTSAMAAILFSGALWAMGHFAPEMRFMALHSRSGASAALLNAVSYIIPNFQILNWRDHLTTPALVWKGIAYSLSYSVACLSMSWIILRKKEF
jgi:ABC-type transport system involved in multi-copper enzyme maturation permease subunit